MIEGCELKGENEYTMTWENSASRRGADEFFRNDR
jgi:hypothetical protein